MIRAHAESRPWPRRLVVLLAVCSALTACASDPPPPPLSPLEAARRAAQDSRDPEVLGSWLLAELLAKGGDAKRARLARLRLSEVGGTGLQASLARAMDCDAHGRFQCAANRYVDVLAAVHRSARPDASLLGWFAANRVSVLRPQVADLWKRAGGLVEQILDQPGSVGWRAAGELIEWWSFEQIHRLPADGLAGLADQIAKRHGCLREALIAGPFGRGVQAEHRVHFAAERPAPWPLVFPEDPRRLEAATTREVERHGCLLRSATSAPAGVYYVQSFIDLPAARDVIIAVQGAHAVFVDDAEILTRDGAQWGVWPRFGVRVRLAPGRHRILARLVTAETSVRVLSSTGAALDLKGSADQAAPYALAPPQRLPDPNPLAPFLADVGVSPQPGGVTVPSSLDVAHPVLRYVAAYLAHVEGADDVASVLLEPLVDQIGGATGLGLAQQAVFVDGDPIFSRAAARDLARDLRERAAALDPELWGPRLWLVLEKAAKSEPAAVVAEMEQLVEQFPEVPAVVKRLAHVYGQLGWVVEHGRTIRRAAEHFPNDLEVLGDLLRYYERTGDVAQADATAARIRRLDPLSEVQFRRAMAQQDYDAAAEQLRQIGRVHRDRRSIDARLADLLVRAGRSSETMAKLELALERDPTDAGTRLALADARLAGGDPDALTDALVEAVRTGSPSGKLRNAVELVEGMTALEPYRRDGLAIVREAEASGVQMEGTAARILDFAALWVAPNGSARMLEHEIIRVQSRDGIRAHVEQKLPRGVVLRMRTVKRDGQVLEPELVAKKPTVTMPHLEVGDYIETESIWMLPGDGQGGRAYLSPRWFFREENVPYHESEFVVISPSARPLNIETTGQVPTPTVERSGALVLRRWRVDRSPALPAEPRSAPVQEFLPSVQVSWGISLEGRLQRLVASQMVSPAADPRLRRIAQTIVAGEIVASGDSEATAALSVDEQARRIYRWVLDTIQPGKEKNAPRIITSKSGDPTLAFLYLCRLIGIDARLGAIQDRLSPPPRGPISEATKFSVPAVRLVTEHGPRWLQVRNRFAPYGYLPSSLRGQPAVLIGLAGPHTSPTPPKLVYETTPETGIEDGIARKAKVTLRRDGSATLDMVQRYRGKYAILMRTHLHDLPEGRLRDVLENRLLRDALPGALFETLEVEDLAKLDEPVTLRMKLEVSNFARPNARGLLLQIPFMPKLAGLVSLDSRETPLYLSEALANRTSVQFDITLPAGAKVLTELEPVWLHERGWRVRVGDELRSDGILRVSRSLDMPAGRVQPSAYPEFREFVLGADAALGRQLRIALSPK